MVIDKRFWTGKKVLITGNTGFKGSWLCIWLQNLGVNVYGYSLNPPTQPSLFNECKIDTFTHTTINDIRNRAALESALVSAQPEVVFHLAAQPLVRESYKNPIETYETNVLGTVNLLEAVRKCPSVRSVVIVTTDKCYENKEWHWGYRENEPMGGYDPYSSSKGCAELVTSAYRQSFFNPREYDKHKVAIASARAGNVIGGGDWAADRLVPDCMKSILDGKKIIVRNPHAIRPWQHVLEPLSGYLLLAQKLYVDGCTYAEGWNFGPDDNDAKSVEWIVNKICNIWGERAQYHAVSDTNAPHEATYLKLDCSKAKSMLNWYPCWTLSTALDNTVSWIKAYRNSADLLKFAISQIEQYQNAENIQA